MKLIDFKNDLLFQRMDLSKELKMQTVCNHLSPDSKTRKPEVDAVMFYYCMAVVNDIETCVEPHDDLSESQETIMWKVLEILNVIAKGIFSYLTVITWGEMRYAGSHGVFHHVDGDTKVVAMAPGSLGGGYGGIVMFPNHNLKNVCSTNLEFFSGYIDGIYEAFNCKAWGGAYGGVKWADIAYILKAFVYGDMPMVVMCDQAFNAEHNTGCIFNKSYLYTCANGMFMKKILNVQAAGQMQELVHAYFAKGQYKELVSGAMTGNTNESKVFNELVTIVFDNDEEALGRDINQWVDWYKIKVLTGAEYGEMKSQQEESEYKEKAKSIKSPEKLSIAKQKNKDPKGKFQIGGLDTVATMKKERKHG